MTRKVSFSCSYILSCFSKSPFAYCHTHCTMLLFAFLLQFPATACLQVLLNITLVTLLLHVCVDRPLKFAFTFRLFALSRDGCYVTAAPTMQTLIFPLLLLLLVMSARRVQLTKEPQLQKAFRGVI